VRESERDREIARQRADVGLRYTTSIPFACVRERERKRARARERERERERERTRVRAREKRERGLFEEFKEFLICASITT
jgi:hypothetical protein